MNRESLRRALARAGRKLARKRCNVHVYRGPDGDIIASEFVPPRPQRGEWLRVRIDGVVEDGSSMRRLGTLADIGIGGVS